MGRHYTVHTVQYSYTLQSTICSMLFLLRNLLTHSLTTPTLARTNSRTSCNFLGYENERETWRRTRRGMWGLFHSTYLRRRAWLEQCIWSKLKDWSQLLIRCTSSYSYSCASSSSWSFIEKKRGRKRKNEECSPFLSCLLTVDCKLYIDLGFFV